MYVSRNGNKARFFASSRKGFKMRNRSLIILLSVGGICLAAGCETEFTSLPQGDAGGTGGTMGTSQPVQRWDESPITGASGTSGTGQAVAGSGGNATAVATGGVMEPVATGGVGGDTPVAGGTPVAGTIPVGGGGVVDVVAGSGGTIEQPPQDAGVIPPEVDAQIIEPPPPEQAVCPPTSSLTPGEITVSIPAGGRDRTFILHVPQSYTGQTPVPLVLDWHGILMSSQFERSISGWAELSDVEGFIVAFPEGIDTAFNLGICCTTSRDVDDIATARAIVDAIKQRGCVDPKRVHSVGYSLGGGMALHVACNAADLFASIAASAFDLIWENDYTCNPSRPIAVMSFRNTDDPICPYGGGPTWPPNGLPVVVNFLGAEGTFTKWSQLDGCTGSPAAGVGGCPTYSGCAEGVEVTLCTNTNQTFGHGWMDAPTAWEFLKRHPMP